MNKNESKYFNTAKKMDDALISLLETKSFEFITIKDICKLAKVNRSTFYLHYENLNDLLEEVISNTNKDFCKSFALVHKKEIDLSNKEELVFINDEYLIPYLQFVKEHSKVYKAVKNNSSLFKADKMEKQIYTDLIEKILDKFQINENYKIYMYDYFVNGIQALIIRWIKNDFDLDVIELTNLIKGLVKRNETNIAK